MRHGLSFDLECYEQIHWRMFLGLDRPPNSNVRDTTHALLDLLAEHKTKATFFALGCIAESFPDVIRRLHAEGHEVGSHGDQHLDVRGLGARAFRDQLLRSKETLEQIIGAPVVAHRAPFFSLTLDSEPALRSLCELGFEYDSSIFPFNGARYGDPRAGSGIHRLPNGLWEVPPSVIDVGLARIPALGGGYVRHFPAAFSVWALNAREAAGLPAVAYFHPWEFSSESLSPGLGVLADAPGSWLRLRCYNLSRSRQRGARMRRKLLRLLQLRRFVPLRELVQEARARAAEQFRDADEARTRPSDVRCLVGDAS